MANLVSYSAQLAILVLACAALPRVLGIRSPSLQYTFWRVLLLLCLVLPIVEPWRHEVVELVAAPGTLNSSAVTDVRSVAALDRRASFRAGAITTVELVLLVGMTARFAWLTLGVIRLRRLRASAVPATDAFDDLRQTIGADATMLWSNAVRHPVTFGLRRPVILLPDTLASSDLAAQRAIVAHELHHVKRRDWAWVTAEEVVRSIFWFHPAVWWLISRVQLARETVVDELSVLTTNARRVYLDALLAFADDMPVMSTPAFSARRHLFHRVMLLSKEESMSSIRIAASSCALVIALGAGAWGAVHAYPLSTTVVSVVPGVAADDQNLPADQSTPPQTRTTPGQLPPPPASPPRDAKPNPPSPPAQDVTDPFMATMERLHPVRIGGELKAPTKIKDVRPVYPADAMASKVTGVVILEAIIDTDGTIADTRILRSIPMLDQAALDAVRQWKFTPTQLNGEPTAIIMTVTVNFMVTVN